MAARTLALVDVGTGPGTRVPGPWPGPAGPGAGGPHRPRGPGNVSRRVRRNRFIASVIVLVLVVGIGWLVAGGSSGSGHATPPPTSPAVHRTLPRTNPRLDPDWRGDGKAVTLGFGGDVNFPSGSTLGDRLAASPTTALGSGVPTLLSGADLTMVNLETALTDGTCPEPQPKTYVFSAPSTALTALKGAGVDLTTEANNHGMDCGQAGLQMSLTEAASAHYPVLGVGQNASQAFTPYQTVIDGQRIGIIAATQVIDSDLNTAWTATSSQPGLASAYDVSALVAAVEAARKVDDTVVVFLHWGVELQTCPDPDQEPLAQILVKAGADLIVGSHAHVLLGGGYLGAAYVDYGLGNFAFYNTPSPTNQSGALVVTATGRHIDAVTWRPALIEDEIPVPLSGTEAATALANWQAARSCTDLSASAGASLATTASETTQPPVSVTTPLTENS